jgi:hypothetical protein
MAHWITRMVCAAVAALALCSSTTAGTVTLYNNLKAQTVGQDLVLPEANGGFLADSFSTGNVALMLTEVKLKLVLVGQPDFDKIKPVVVSVYKDDGKPGVGDLVHEIGRITEEAVKDDGPVISVTANPGDVPLAANSRYWVVLTDITPADNGKQTISWTWSTDITGTGVKSEYYIDKSGLSANNDTHFGPFQMQVIAQSTPEPSSVVLLAVGISGSGITCVRSRNRCRADV